MARLGRSAQKFMFIAGLILSIIGGVLLWASAMGLSFSKTKAEISAGEALDFFVLGGVITFFRDLFAAISEGIHVKRGQATKFDTRKSKAILVSYRRDTGEKLADISETQQSRGHQRSFALKMGEKTRISANDSG